MFFDKYEGITVRNYYLRNIPLKGVFTLKMPYLLLNSLAILSNLLMGPWIK